MNKISIILSLFFAIILLTHTPAQAEEIKKPLPKADFLTVVDKNADGKASKEEFFAAMEKKFHSMDVDKSDVVSVQELKLYGEKDEETKKKLQQLASLEKNSKKGLTKDDFLTLFVQRAQQEFAQLDKNHDNKLNAHELGADSATNKNASKTKEFSEKLLTKEEFIAGFSKRAERNFFKLDQNYNGKLSNQELSGGVIESKPATTAQEAGSEQQKAKNDKSRQQKKLIQSFFVGIDANQDGQINNAEKNAAFERLFQRLDSNHNQFITFDEIIAGRHRFLPENP